MKLDQLVRQLCKIACQRPKGFTFSPVIGHFAQAGYAVASAHTQDCFGISGLHRVIKFFMLHRDYCIGGWKNEDGVMQFDASKVYGNIEEAVLAAIENKQRAIFDLNTQCVIMECDYDRFLKCSAAA